MTSAIQIYAAANGQLTLDVRLEGETVWLTQEQMGQLFERERSVVTKHIRNVFAEGELVENSNVQNLHIAGSDKPVKFFNLDVIISVGYRVKSKRGVQFRQWATRTLKQHLVQGYTLNQQRLAERGIEFEQAVTLLSRTLANQQLVNADGAAVLAVIADYARSWSLLQQYDEESVPSQTHPQSGMQSLAFPDVLVAIGQLKAGLMAKGEASYLFGQLRGGGLAVGGGAGPEGMAVGRVRAVRRRWPSLNRTGGKDGAFTGRQGGPPPQPRFLKSIFGARGDVLGSESSPQ